MRERLTESLAPTVLEIEDEGHLHRGHVGARDGRGHFRVRLWSDQLAELKPLARHRAVYEALGDLMQTDIHALSLVFAAPESTPS
ncbi:MAG: BolA family protein [Pseudomonadota bacterium]